jgi:hypothetical protein
MLFLDFYYSHTTAFDGQTLRQAPQRVHAAVTIRWAVFRSPWMAWDGQTAAHWPHPMHNDGSIRSVISLRQTPAGHFLS